MPWLLFLKTLVLSPEGRARVKRGGAKVATISVVLLALGKGLEQKHDELVGAVKAVDARVTQLASQQDWTMRQLIEIERDRGRGARARIMELERLAIIAASPKPTPEPTSN